MAGKATLKPVGLQYKTWRISRLGFSLNSIIYYCRLLSFCFHFLPHKTGDTSLLPQRDLVTYNLLSLGDMVVQ